MKRNGSIIRLAAAAGAAAAVLVIAGITGAQESGDILIGDGIRIHPESIGATPDGGLLIGSLTGPNVYRYSPGDDAAVLWATVGDVIEGGIVTGVFARGDTAYVCANAPFSGPPSGTVVTFDLDSGDQTGVFAFPGGGFCNDIAVSPDGTLFATDTSFGSSPGRVLALVADDEGVMGFTTVVAGTSIGGVDGLAFMGDTLFVNDVTASRLYRIELDGSVLVSFETLNLSQAVNGPDGMRTTEDGTGMLLTGGDRIVLVTIDGDNANIEVVQDGFAGAAGVAQVGNTAYVVEPNFGSLFDPNAPDPGLFYVKAVPLAGQAPTETVVDPALLTALMDEGATVYSRNCRGCHGRNGEGQQPAQDAAPALAGNSSLRSVGLIVFQVINGGDYMPPFGGLSNRQIAAVATYIRNSFGNDFGIATEEDVAN